MQKKLSKNFKKDLSENGYIVVKNLFEKSEVKHLLNSFGENIDYCNKITKNKRIQLSNIDQKYQYLKKQNNLLRSRSYDISKFHPSLFKLATKKQLLNIIKKLFGETFFLDYPQIRVDDIKNSYSLPLHQEIFGQMSSKILTLWLPLTNVSKKKGTLILVKKSHKLGPLKHKFFRIKGNNYHGVKKEIIKKYKIDYLNLNAGDGVIFDPYLIHGTGKNSTKKIRWTFVARYNAISGINYLKNKNSPLRIKQK